MAMTVEKYSRMTRAQFECMSIEEHARLAPPWARSGGAGLRPLMTVDGARLTKTDDGWSPPNTEIEFIYMNERDNPSGWMVLENGSEWNWGEPFGTLEDAVTAANNDEYLELDFERQSDE